MRSLPSRPFSLLDHLGDRRGSARAALATGDRYLVLVQSIKHAGIASRLLATLSMDEYQVALVCAPGQDPDDLLFASSPGALGAGLRVLPSSAWATAIAAADVVVADPGPLWGWAAAAGRAVLSIYPENVQGTLPGELAAVVALAPALGLPWRDGPEGLIVRAQELREVTHPLALRAVPALTVPTQDPDRPVPPLAPATEHPMVSMRTRADLREVLHVHRAPRFGDHELDDEPRHRYLVVQVGTDAPDPPRRGGVGGMWWLISSAQVIARESRTGIDAVHDDWWAHQAFRHWSARQIVSYTPTGCVVHTRHGTRISYRWDLAGVDPVLVAGLMHPAGYDADVAGSLHGALSGPVPVRICTGTRERTVTLEWLSQRRR